MRSADKREKPQRKNGNRYWVYANPDMADGLREIAKSGAAGPHQDKRHRRTRTRQAQKSRALKWENS